MTTAPTNIKSHQQSRELELQWADGRTSRLGYALLRGECPCANCISELTGERLLDVTTIPDDIHPQNIELIGNYALQINWSDGHNTGIYTWEKLASLCE